MRYYAPYEGLTLNSRTEKHMEAIVNRKLEAGEIHIGRPVLRSSESVTTNDEGRYVVTSHIQNQEAR
jgi:hypothetical protein